MNLLCLYFNENYYCLTKQNYISETKIFYSLCLECYIYPTFSVKPQFKNLQKFNCHNCDILTIV